MLNTEYVELAERKEYKILRRKANLYSNEFSVIFQGSLSVFLYL